MNNCLKYHHFISHTSETCDEVNRNNCLKYHNFISHTTEAPFVNCNKTWLKSYQKITESQNETELISVFNVCYFIDIYDNFVSIPQKYHYAVIMQIQSSNHYHLWDAALNQLVPSILRTKSQCSDYVQTYHTATMP